MENKPTKTDIKVQTYENQGQIEPQTQEFKEPEWMMILRRIINERAKNNSKLGEMASN